MRVSYPRIGLAGLCGWFGLSRQAYYQHFRQQADEGIAEELVLQEVHKIRKDHPRLGTRKLIKMLGSFLDAHRVKMGRDGLFRLLSDNYMLVRRRRRSVRTTYSSHWLRKYPNLVREYVPTAPGQLWVSDITYWRVSEGHFLYISLITDAYSHKVVGYHVSENLEAEGCLQALKMAIADLKPGVRLGLIHHSDRGLQYCSQDYVKLLTEHGIKISMTENGDPLENALAERMNGILKNEYLNHYYVQTIEEARNLIAKKVNLYNSSRPHMSIGNLTPDAVHKSEVSLITKKLWKNYYRKNPEPVNLGQDLGTIVNQCQDYQFNL
jgi:putative transposase